MAVNQKPKHLVQLYTGEKRDGVNQSSRLFFVYQTPTGAEMALARCPALAKIFSQTNGAFDSDLRATTTEYEVRTPTTLKMVNLFSTFGKPKRVVNLIIDLNPEAELIELQGLGGFGGFKGRGKIDYKQSTYFSNRDRYALTETIMKEHFGLRTLQPAVKAGAGVSTRSLIFE